MVAKRLISCLDIKDGRTVKGINFENIQDAGDPVELAIAHAEQGIDELVFLDISATNEKRKTLSELVTRIAKNINIPFTVGGGISSVEDVYTLLNAGADKISVNTSAYKNPELINELSSQFGSQCIVLAIDTKFENNDWYVYLNGGKIKTETKALDWAVEGMNRGAGEILLTSMNNDGTKNGFALDITKLISENVSIPVIASGGAGNMQHFADAFTKGKADAALAASVFHYKEIKIQELKQFLIQQQIEIRN
jgi:cyclase